MLKKLFPFAEKKEKPKTIPEHSKAETGECDLRQKLISLFESGETTDALVIIKETQKALSKKELALDAEERDLRFKAREGLKRNPLNQLLELGITEHLALKNYNGYKERIYEPMMKKIQTAKKSVRPLMDAVKKRATADANAVRLEKLRTKTKRGVKTNQPGAVDRLTEIERQISENNEEKAEAEAKFKAAISSFDFPIFNREETAKITAKVEDENLNN